jgi:hypothetical protein
MSRDVGHDEIQEPVPHDEVEVVAADLRRRPIAGRDLEIGNHRRGVRQQQLLDDRGHFHLLRQPLPLLDVAVSIETGDRPHPGSQFDAVERLRDEVVGAGFDAADSRLAIAQRRHHDHRDFGDGRIGAQLPAHRVAIEVRHVHVEQHEIGSHLAGQAQRRLSRFGEHEMIAARSEHQFQHPPRDAIVAGQENGRQRPARRGCPRTR